MLPSSYVCLLPSSHHANYELTHTSCISITHILFLTTFYPFYCYHWLFRNVVDECLVEFASKSFLLLTSCIIPHVCRLRSTFLFTCVRFACDQMRWWNLCTRLTCSLIGGMISAGNEPMTKTVIYRYYSIDKWETRSESDAREWQRWLSQFCNDALANFGTELHVVQRHREAAVVPADIFVLPVRHRKGLLHLILGYWVKAKDRISH